MNKEQIEELMYSMQCLDDACSALAEMREEMQEVFDSMPEKSQESTRGLSIMNTIDTLTDWVGEILEVYYKIEQYSKRNETEN